MKKKKKQKKEIRNQEGMIVQLLKRLYNEDVVFVSCGSLCKVEESELKRFRACQHGIPGDSKHFSKLKMVGFLSEKSMLFYTCYREANERVTPDTLCWTVSWHSTVLQDGFRLFRVSRSIKELCSLCPCLF